MVSNEFEGLDFFVNSLFGSNSFVKQYNDLICSDEVKGLIPEIFDDGKGNISFNDFIFNAYCDFGKDAIFDEALKKFGDDYSYDEEVVGQLKEDKFEFKNPKDIAAKSQIMRPKRLLGIYANARETTRFYSGIKDFDENEINSVLREIRDSGLGRAYEFDKDMIRNMYIQFEKAKVVLEYFEKSLVDKKMVNELRKKADLISNELLKTDRDFINRDFDIESYLDSEDGIKAVSKVLAYKKENDDLDLSFYNPKRTKGLDFLVILGEENLIKEDDTKNSLEVVKTLDDSTDLPYNILKYNQIIKTLRKGINTSDLALSSTLSDWPYLIFMKEVYISAKKFGGNEGIESLKEILCDIENLERKKLSGEYSNLDFDDKRVEKFSNLLEETAEFKKNFKVISKYKELDLTEALSKKYGEDKGYLYSVLSGITDIYGEVYLELLKDVHNFEKEIRDRDRKNLLPLDIDGETTELFEELRDFVKEKEPSMFGEPGEIFSESGAFGTLYKDIDEIQKRVLGSAKKSVDSTPKDTKEAKAEGKNIDLVASKVEIERVYDLSRYKCRDVGQYVLDVSRVLKEKLRDECPDKFSDMFDVKIYAKDDDPNKISGEDRLKCVEDRLNSIFNQYFSFPREGKDPDYEILPLIEEAYRHFSEKDKKDRHFVREIKKAVKAKDISVLSYDSLMKIQNKFFGEYRVPAFGGHDFTLSLFMNKNELDRANKELSDVLKIDKNVDYENFFNERGDIAKRKIEGLFCDNSYKGTKGKTMEEKGLEVKAKEISRLFSDPKDIYHLEIKIKPDIVC